MWFNRTYGGGNKMEPTQQTHSGRSVAGTLMHELNPVSQNGKILLHLIRVGPITQLVAWELYRVHRLASRISDLKVKGVPISANTKLDATGVRYTEYSIL